MIAYQHGKLHGLPNEAVLVTLLEEKADDPKNYLWESYVLVYPGSVGLIAKSKQKMPRDKRPLAEPFKEVQAGTTSLFENWATELANARGTASPLGPAIVDCVEPPFAKLLWSGKCKTQVELIEKETGSTELKKIVQRALRLPVPTRPAI